MKIVSTIEEVRAQVKEWKKEGLSIGFVPTMGYLHEGHMSLIDAAGENDRVVVSIFVNPMQFGPTEDLASYPRDLEHDAKLCEEHGVDLIFHPTPEEMYGDQFYSYVDMDVLTKELCGLQQTGTLPRRVHGCDKTFQYCDAGPRIFRTERRAAACGYQENGKRSEHAAYDYRLPDHPRGGRTCKKFS